MTRKSKDAAPETTDPPQNFAPNRKRNILVTAERLFAERGYHGVSIRDIADEAGVPLALVGYHFGPKLELLHAIFRERSGYIGERLEALASAQREAPKSQLLERIVEAFIAPVLTVAEQPEGRNFVRLLARGITEQLPEAEAPIRELFDPLAHAFIDALTAAVPNADRPTVVWCYQFALHSLLNLIADARVERLSRGANRFGDFATAGPILVRFVCAGICGVCAAQVQARGPKVVSLSARGRAKR